MERNGAWGTSPGGLISRNQLPLLIVSVLGSLALGAVWLSIDWVWSPVDDPGQVLAMKTLIEEQGRISAVLTRTEGLMRGDRAGGIFRPGAYIYPPLIYQLSVEWAHLARLVMICMALVGPIVYFKRAGASRLRLFAIVLIMLAAASSLYQGLFLLSLQEASGAAFVGLGLLVRGRAARIVFWTAAAFFKAPFAWLLIGYAVALWRRGERRLAVGTAGIGVLILGVSAYWSRSGTYSAGYSLDPLNPVLWQNAINLSEFYNALLLVAAVWWAVSTDTRLRASSHSVVFGIGWAGYTLQMLPWGVTAYYMGPISYLLGLTIASLLTDPRHLSRLRTVVAFFVPALVAVLLVRAPLVLGFEMNEIMRQSRDCLAEVEAPNALLSGSGYLYITSSDEGAIRMAENVKLLKPSWEGNVQLDSAENSLLSDPSFTHLLVLRGTEPAETRNPQLICSSDYVRLYELD